MGAYDYPQVRPPSAMQIERHQHSAQPQPIGLDPRHFSWVQTPIESRGRGLGRQENIPPLPQVPVHLSATPRPQPEQHRAQTHSEYPPDIKSEGNMASMYPNQPWRSAAEGLTEQPSLHLIHDNTPTPPLPTHQPQRKKIQPSNLPIGPDENPIGPLSPSRTTTTTNLPIIPPSASTPTYNTTFSQPTQSTQGGTWASSLFSCSDPTICLPSIFCPCIVYGKTQYRLSLRAEKKDPTNMLGYNTINGSCVAFGILCGINGLMAAIQHTRVRKSYNMSGEAGNVFSDCVRGCCCCCCTVAQDEKEVKRRESGGIPEKAGEAPPYQPPEGMVFAAPPR